MARLCSVSRSAGRLCHGVDRHAAVDPTRVVPLEQVVGQRREQEIVDSQGRPFQAVHASGMQIGLEDPSDEISRQGDAVGALEEPAEGIDQLRTHHLGSAHPVQDERLALGDPEGLGQELGVVVDTNTLLPQCLGKGVMFFAGLLRPHHVVEEQALDVVRSEPRELVTRPMQHRLAKLSDFGVDPEGHDGRLVSSRNRTERHVTQPSSFWNSLMSTVTTS